jgi:hypothetical protein
MVRVSTESLRKRPCQTCSIISSLVTTSPRWRARKTSRSTSRGRRLVSLPPLTREQARGSIVHSATRNCPGRHQARSDDQGHDRQCDLPEHDAPPRCHSMQQGGVGLHKRATFRLRTPRTPGLSRRRLGVAVGHGSVVGFPRNPGACHTVQKCYIDDRETSRQCESARAASFRCSRATQRRGGRSPTTCTGSASSSSTPTTRCSC